MTHKAFDTTTEWDIDHFVDLTEVHAFVCFASCKSYAISIIPGLLYLFFLCHHEHTLVQWPTFQCHQAQLNIMYKEHYRISTKHY